MHMKLWLKVHRTKEVIYVAQSLMGRGLSFVGKGNCIRAPATQWAAQHLRGVNLPQRCSSTMCSRGQHLVLNVQPGCSFSNITDQKYWLKSTDKSQVECVHGISGDGVSQLLHQPHWFSRGTQSVTYHWISAVGSVCLSKYWIGLVVTIDNCLQLKYMEGISKHWQESLKMGKV